VQPRCGNAFLKKKEAGFKKGSLFLTINFATVLKTAFLSHDGY
jgi:hypothetical protein